LGAIVVRVLRALTPEDVQIRAAGVAFYGFLALLPALLAVVMLYGIIAEPDEIAHHLKVLSPLFPPEVAQFLGSRIVEMVRQSQGGLVRNAVISLLVGVWGASKGIRALLHTLGTGGTRVVGADVKGRMRRKVLALALAAGGVFVAAFGVLAILAVPSLLQFFGMPVLGARLINWMRWPTLAAAVLGWLTVLYHSRPLQRDKPWRFSVLGAAIATLAWLGVSVAFSTLVGRFGGKDILYGSLAAAVMLLTWFLLASYTVLLGAEVAAATEWAANAETKASA
jgi:membrane protein